LEKLSGCLALAVFLGTALLLVACSKETVEKPVVSDPAIVGTWIKFGSPTQTMTLTMKSDCTFEADFTGDSQIDVWGDCSPSGGQITFVDVGGQHACGPDSGIYRYHIVEDELTFSLIRDSCRGRTRPTVGTWANKGILEDCNKAITANSQDAKVYIRRGKIKFILLDSQGALADFEKAIELKPGYANAYSSRASIKATLLKDYAAALADFDKAISLDPEYDQAYFDRGLVKHYLNDRDGACADWKKALELGLGQAENIIERFCQ
jgi:hypothetical protein